MYLKDVLFVDVGIFADHAPEALIEALRGDIYKLTGEKARLQRENEVSHSYFEKQQRYCSNKCGNNTAF